MVRPRQWEVLYLHIRLGDRVPRSSGAEEPIPLRFPER